MGGRTPHTHSETVLPGADVVLLCVVIATLVVIGAGLFSTRWLQIATIQLGAIAVPTIAVARARGPAAALLGLTRPGPRALIGGFLFGSTGWFVALVVIAPTAEQILGPAPTTALSSDLTVFTAVALITLPPLCEELLFRGAIARSVRRRFGLAAGVISSAVLFAAFHITPAQMPGMLFLGILFASGSLLSGSTWVGIAAHFMNNLMVLAANGPAASELAWMADNPLLTTPVAALIAAVGVGLTATRRGV